MGAHLLEVGRVQEVIQSDKVLLDATRRHEAVEDGHTSSLVVGATSTRTAERLLTDDGTRAFFVVVHVTSSVAKLVGCLEESLAVR